MRLAKIHTERRVFERKGKKGSTWYIDFTSKGRRTIKTVGPDRKMAELASKKIKTQIFEGKFFPESRRCRVRFRDFAEEYMEKHSRRTKRSWPMDEHSLKHLLPRFGDVFLSDITPRMIENYRIKREKDGVKPATINRERALLKNMFTKAINWDVVRDNPAKKVPMGKEEPRIRFLSKEEISQKGEILNLRWVDADFDGRAIQVKKTKNDQPREMPMTDWLFNTLWNWKQKRLDTEFVFTHNNRQPIRSLRTAFERALKRAGIEDFRFHDLRHTAASQMYMSGLDIKFIKEIGGWKTLQMVDRYSHISMEHKRVSMLIFESHLHPSIDTKPQQIKRALS